MKTLTLAAVAMALLGLLLGCDEPQTMMGEITRETPPITPTEPRGEVTLQETDCPFSWLCSVGISYTNVPNEDGTGKLTIYFDIPDALGDGPHRVILRYGNERLQTDIPHKRIVEHEEQFANGEWERWTETEATFFFDRGGESKITLEYQLLLKENGIFLNTVLTILDGISVRDLDAADDYINTVDPGFFDSRISEPQWVDWTHELPFVEIVIDPRN